jgi:hypothetical protein
VKSEKRKEKSEGGAGWQPGKQTHNAVVQMTNAARRSANKCRNFEQRQR